MMSLLHRYVLKRFIYCYVLSAIGFIGFFLVVDLRLQKNKRALLMQSLVCVACPLLIVQSVVCSCALLTV